MLKFSDFHGIAKLLPGLQEKNLRIEYKDKDGEFKHTDSFRDNDLPKLVLVAQRAYEYLTMKEEEEAYPDAQEVE